MLLLQLTPQGQQKFDSLKTNPNATLRITKVLFSNLNQPIGDTILTGNTMYGTPQEGFLLFGYRMMLSNFPTIVCVCYIDRILFQAPDWIPRSFGLYDNTGTLLCYGNVKPTDYEVGLLVKSGIVLFDFQIDVLERIFVDGIYSSIINLNQFVVNNLKNKSSSGTCPQPNILYNHFKLNDDLDLVSYGIKAKTSDNTIVKLYYDDVNHILVGEVI